MSTEAVVETAWPTPKEAAIALGIDVRTVYRMIDHGRLRYRVKPGDAPERPRFLIDPTHISELKIPA